jgi:hypothetical protein
MLVGHEVGHALFTPNEDWRDVADIPKDYINVIEDARIEKLMKRKFPGLNKSFSRGYKELHDMDFFSVQGEDLSTYSLIDRINLHFKIGASAMIPFSIEEKLFVARTDLAETFEEVLQIAQDVYAFSQSQQETNEVEIPFTPEESDSDDNVQGSNAVSSEKKDSESSDEQNQPNAKSQSGGESSGGTHANIDEDIIDDWDDEDEEDDDAGSEGGTGSETQRSFDDASEKLSSPDSKNLTYVEIPEKVDLDRHVVDWKKLHNWIDSQALESIAYAEVDQKYNEFRKQSHKEVNYLVKEFECRKSADAYARAGQSKTGVLDTAKLHTYLYNEDIFKK